MTTPTEPPDPWAQVPSMTPEQGGQPAPPGAPPGWGAPPAGPPPAQPWGTPPAGPPPAQPWGAPPGYNPPPGAPPGYGPPPGQPGGYYPPPGWGQPTGARNGLGVASLVLAIVGLLAACFGVGVVLGILAVIFGFVGRGRASRGEATNGGVALAGIIVGFAATIAGIIAIVWFVSFAGHGFSDYRDCLRHAHTQQERADCQDQFQNSFNNP